jgi:hypothetical protein
MFIKIKWLHIYFFRIKKYVYDLHILSLTGSYKGTHPENYKGRLKMYLDYSG